MAAKKRTKKLSDNQVSEQKVPDSKDAGKKGSGKEPSSSRSAIARSSANKQSENHGGADLMGTRKGIKKPARSLEKLMANFQDARLSDVSDKVFVASSPVHGKGLFAAKKLKAGTFISRLQGMPTYDDGIYVLWITDEIGLELTNDLKFINHDKNPNAAYSDLDVTIVRDVEAGEELLHDYGW